jgi:hypothetical protein
MKRIPSILALAALVATCWNADAISIFEGPVYNPASGHTYYLLSPASWDTAEIFSQSLGGHLLTINDAAENTWIEQTFLVPHPTINPNIGLTEYGHIGTWTWISGEPVTYLNWGPGEPNFAWEHWSNLFPADWAISGTWNNTIETDIVYSIAEVPEPSVLSLGALALGMLFARRHRR